MICVSEQGLAFDAKLPGLDPRDVEQIIDQRQEQLTMFPDVAEILPISGGPCRRKGCSASSSLKPSSAV